MSSTLWSGKPRAPFPWLKPTTKHLIEEELLAKFRTEAERQFRMREAYQKNVYIREKYFKLARKKKLYDEYRRKVYGKRIKEEYAKALHAALRTSWHQMEAIEELKDMAAREKSATKASNENREEWITTQRELDNFDVKREEEMQLLEEASTPKGKGKGRKDVGKPPKGPLPKVPAVPARKLAQQKGKKMFAQKQVETLEMPDLVVMAQKVGEYVAAVKAKRAKEIVDKFEQRQLERKEKMEKEAEETRLKNEMQKKMVEAQTWEHIHGEEARIRQEEENVARLKEEEEVDKRREQSSALVEARNVEWLQATARDREIFTMMRDDYTDEVYREWMLWEAEKERKAEQKRLNRLWTCAEIILQLVTMVEIRNDYKDEFNTEMSASTWRGWKTLFTKGHILPCPIWNEDLPRDHPWADPNEVFAKEAMTQYLEEQGEWQSLYAIGKNKELAAILWEILGVVDSRPPPTSEPINLTKFKLKMAVVGAPYTGKTTIANKLEEDFQIVKIELPNVIASALALAEVEEQNHKLQVADEEVKRAELEAKLLEAEKQKIRGDLDAEASGNKELVLREKRKPEELPPEVPAAKSPKDDKISKREKSPEKEKSKGKEKDKVKEKEKQGKERVKQKAEQEINGDVYPEKAAEEEPEKPGLKPTEGILGNTVEEMLEPVPTLVPDPVIDLSYFTPKARFGMDIRLAREKGLQPPPQALAGLVVLTVLNLPEYAVAFAQAPALKKGAKNPFQAKKDAVRKEKDAAKMEEAKKTPKVPLKPPLKGGKGGPKGTAAKDAVVKKGPPAVPEEKQWGFILDGFPSNAEEAKAFELQLSGVDVEYMARNLAKASKIAPPPQLDLTETMTSGLDGYLQLETLEEKEALKRAMGKVLDPKTGRIYHLEYDPPPANVKGLAQRLKPLEELEYVRTKIITGADAWGPLSDHFATFSNVFKVVQVQEDNRNIVDTEGPYNLAQRFLDGWNKTQAAKAAATAALEAEIAATKALAEAEQASKVATEVAEHYWKAKLAEVETENVLDALGGNPLAKKLIKEKVTVTLTERFDETCNAVQEAEEAAESARGFAMYAQQMAQEAHDKVTEADLEFAFHVREEAEAARESAKEAAIRAGSSLEKAVAAFESAKAALNPPPVEEKPPPHKKDKEPGKKGKETGKMDKGKDKEKEAGRKEKDKNAEGAKKRKEAPGKTDAKGVNKEAGKASSKGGSTETKDDSSNPVSPTTVAPPEPPEFPPLEKEFAVALHTEWEKVEATYFHDLESVFYALHQERATTRDLVVETISTFVAHLQNRDDRQLIFNDFQEKYNRVEIPDRRDKKVKPKLQQEVVKLEKTLNGLMEARTKKCRDLSEQSLISLLDSRVTSLVDLFTTLVQTELDRHLQTSSFLKEYFTKSMGTDILKTFSCTLKEVATEPAASFAVPGWLITLSSPLPKLYRAIMTTMQVAYDILATVFGQAKEKSNKKKKKGEKTENSDKSPEKAEKKGKSKKRDGEINEADEVKEAPQEILETPPPPVDEGIPPAAGREHQVLLQRLQRVAKVALNYFLELQPIVDGAYRRMDEWGKSRLNAEAEVVKEVLDLATHAVDENIPLWYKVILDGDQFVVDENQLQLECSLTDLTSIDFWHWKFMEDLLKAFRKLAVEGGNEPSSEGKQKASKKKKEKDKDKKEKDKKQEKKEKDQDKEARGSKEGVELPGEPPANPLSNYVTVAAAKAATDQALEAAHTSFKDDLKESLLPRLPASRNRPRGPFQDWQNRSNDMFQELIDDETKGSRFIDWRAFLIALVDAHYLFIISSATCEDLVNTRRDDTWDPYPASEAVLFSHSPTRNSATDCPYAFMPNKHLEPFFEAAITNKPPEAAGFLTVEEFLRVPLWFDSSTPVPPGEFDLGVSVKAFVFDALSDGYKDVPWLKLLLYLCRDPDPYIALQKAFCVISGTISDDTRLTPEEVLLILYPGGINAAWKAEIVPFVMEDVQNLLYWVAREKFVKKEKEEESDFGGSEESDSHDLEVDRASTESSRSELDTVDDFLGFAYQEFPDLIQAETVNDFLESLADVAPLDDTEEVVPERPYKCDVHRIPTGPCREYNDADEFAIPTTYTLDDIVQTEAMTRLRDVLYCNYTSETIQSFEKTPIEDDEVEESVETDAEGTTTKNTKKKGKAGDSEDSEGSDDKPEKKKKKKKEK